MLHLIVDTWAGSLLRIIGVCVLYTIGHIVRIFRPSSTAYSFKAIYRMDYDKGDSYKQMMERAGQQITGAIFLGTVLMLICLFKV
jgi:hypothetical protein